MIWILEDDPQRIKFFIKQFPGAFVTDNAEEMLNCFRAGNVPTWLFLDHDLDGRMTSENATMVDRPNNGMEVVRWLAKHAGTHAPLLKNIVVHSLNINGWPQRMVRQLTRYGYNPVRMPFSPPMMDSLARGSFIQDFPLLVAASAPYESSSRFATGWDE